MSTNVILQPSLRVGEYELVRQLGAGGMGDVWLATDTRADRPVALKFIKPQLLSDPSFRVRFLNEARTLGRLEHDRIVTLYNVLEVEGHLALVLRYIPGRSLADRIDDEGQLPVDAVLAYARDLLPALGFAHAQGIIHRDIKPQNVLLDDKGRAFLTDFGIAVADVVQRSTMTGFSIGTPHYMSPEQIQTPDRISVEHEGHRSDIYSFGVVLFEMLTGRVPFGADLGPTDVYRVQNAHCVEAPPPLRQYCEALPESIERVVLACLAKEPGERPQTCAALLADLEGAAAGRPSARAARPVTAFEPAPRPVPAPSSAAVAPAQTPRPVTGRSGPGKTLWLGAGAAAIVALVSAAMWAQRGGEQAAQTPPAQATDAARDLVPSSAPKPKPEGGGSVAPLRPQGTGATPQLPPVAPPPTPVVETVPPPSGASAAIAALAAEARQLGGREQWCLAKQKMDEAERLGSLSSNDRYFQNQAAIACGLTATQ